MSYFKFKKRPPKTTERQKLVHKLDDLFSEYIRLRNADENGNVRCITCGDQYHWRDVQCGHYVKRGNASTRYNLYNCGEQCATCNCANDGMEDAHKEYIDRTYGEGTADMLERLGREELKLSEHDLQGMADELKKEIKAVRIEKGMI